MDHVSIGGGAAECPGSSADEEGRLASLYSFGILDTPAEEGFDRLVALAAEICDTPMALVSLIDSDRQWYKARIGLEVTETPRAGSFCEYAVAGPDDVMVVPDARADDRFSANPYVSGDPHVRLYACAVLRDGDGRGLGALCVLDRRARRLTDTQLNALATLGRQVGALLDLRRRSTALTHAEAALDAATDGHARRAVITLDADLRVQGWSGDAERMFGYPAAMAVGRVLTDVLQTVGTPSKRKKTFATVKRQGWWEDDVTHHRRNGSPVRVHCRLEVRLDSGGEVIGYVAHNEDLTSPDIERLCHETYADVVARMATGELLVTLCADLCRVVEKGFPGAHATVMAINAKTGRLELVASPSLSSRFAAAVAEVPVGAGIGSCGTAAHLGQVVVSANIFADPAWDEWNDAPRAEKLLSCWSHPILGPAGTVLGTFAVYWSVLHEPSGDERQLVTTLASLAAIMFTARRSELSGYGVDELTGLMTRGGLDRWMAGLGSDAEVCVVALDMDRFGSVNQQYGLEVGDEALRQIAGRVRSESRDAPAVARFASDQFVVVRTAARQPRRLADGLLAAVRQPLQIEGNELWLTASVGLARGPGGYGQRILNDALAAAGGARRLGGDQVLDAEIIPANLTASSLEMVGALYRAVALGSLEVFYQPKVSIATGAVESVEALARWDRGNGASVGPSVFVPLAEEIGLIGALGEQVLRRACADAAGWDAGPTGVAPTVAVNISGRQLIPGVLAATVAAALADAALPANRLTLEVTETALAVDVDSAISSLREVKAVGVSVAIDDFGVGYSSLGRLSRFPIDELKIDRSFVERIGDDGDDDAIVRSVVALSRALGLRCVAEGVEQVEQLRFLATLGCDAFQGYLFSPAVTARELIPLLAGYVLPWTVPIAV